MILKKLKEEGNDLYIITARGIHNEQIIEITKIFLKKLEWIYLRSVIGQF